MSNTVNIPKNQVLTRNTIDQREHEDDAWARRVINVDEEGNPFNDINRFPVEAVVTISQAAADTPTITNISVLLANTEYSYTFPAKTVKFTLKVRELDAKLKYTWVAGQSGTQYITVNYGVSEIKEQVFLDGKTIYFQINKPGKVVEIESWA